MLKLLELPISSFPVNFLFPSIYICPMRSDKPIKTNLKFMTYYNLTYYLTHYKVGQYFRLLQTYCRCSASVLQPQPCAKINQETPKPTSLNGLFSFWCFLNSLNVFLIDLSLQIGKQTVKTTTRKLTNQSCPHFPLEREQIPTALLRDQQTGHKTNCQSLLPAMGNSLDKN